MIEKKEKLERLTEEQKELMIKVREEWLNKLFDGYKPIDKEGCNKGIDFIYGLAGFGSPIKIYVSSPMAAQIAANLLVKFYEVLGKSKNEVWNKVKNEVGNKVRNEVWNKVRNEVWNKVENEVGNKVLNEVWNKVKNEVGNKVRNEVGNEVLNEVWNKVGNEVEESTLKYFAFAPYGGIWDYGWCSFYDFFTRIGIVNNDKFNKFVQLLNSGTYNCIYLKGFCIICEKPININRKDKKLHSETDCAIKWQDGYGQYFLNGVVVPKWLALTPIKNIDCRKIYGITNTEIRREFVRKVGIERIMIELGSESIDKDGDYELLLFDIGDGNKRPYLRMLNPSIRIWHLEGVEPGVASVQDALDARKPKELRKIPVSNDGADWYQQGDVCIWPKSAKAVKPRPSKLT